MRDLDQRLADVANAPANTDFDELVAVMKAAGFEFRMGKKGHGIFTNRAYGVRQTVARPHHGPVKPVYVKDCLNAIDKLRALQEKTDG